MIIKCNLDSCINLKLLSHFKPEKFDFESLQKAKALSTEGLFLLYLKRDIRTYDIRMSGSEVILDYYEPKELENNFGSLEKTKLSEITLCCENNIPKIDFITENKVEYPECEIIHIKFDGTLRGILCKMSGIGNYLIYDVKNCLICILGKDQFEVCKKLMGNL